MASIIKKKIKGITYYYYTESKRINGKSKHVNQKYLGTADKVLSKCTQSSVLPQPLFSKILDFADVTVLYDIASRLDIVDTINEFSSKRAQGVSVGEYILIAAINRAVAPTSKNQMADWFYDTVLYQFMDIDKKSLTSQQFWNNMSLSDGEIEKIEDKLVKNMLSSYNIQTSHLIYDATNFFTYIDTMQDSTLAKRGHSKEKRNDLRIVGLSMMITPDCNIPLLYDTYPGNTPDSKQFAIMIEKLKSRYENIMLQKTDLTIVFDRGNNSEANIALLENEDFAIHYVGGLKSNQCSELFEVPKSKFMPLDGFHLKKVSAFRTSKTVYKRNMTVIVAFNENLLEGQMQGILINIEKTLQGLAEIQTRLLNRAEGIITKGRAPTAASIEKQVNALLKTEYMKDIFDVEITSYNGLPFLKYSLNSDKLQYIKNTFLGKTVLFTNRHSWTSEEIVSAYRSAWHVEHVFRQLKDTEHLTVRPLFHWTDQKIKIHIFYCVLAYRLCCLLQKELQDGGVLVSIPVILDELKRVKHVTTVFGLKKDDIVYSLSKGNDLADTIISFYNLKDKYFIS